MFFGSMLVLISTDLMWEWLVMAAAKMMGTEYAVCIATFVAIMIMGIETGTAQRSTAHSEPFSEHSTPLGRYSN
jgi:predicted membrane protein